MTLKSNSVMKTLIGLTEVLAAECMQQQVIPAVSLVP